MSAAKRIALTLIVGAAAGVLIALLVAPGMIEWWAKPALPTVCSCVEQIQWALARLRISLFIAAAITAAIAVVLVEIVRRRRAPKPEPAA